MKICAVVLGIVLAAFAGRAEPMHLFLLAGQSNMAGRGKIDPAVNGEIAGAAMLNRSNCWVSAKEPFHFDKPSAGAGLAAEFVRCYLKKHPGVKVGLVPCAVGGSGISLWNPELPSGLYATAVARVRIAQKEGELKGILWHQGESNLGAKDGFAAYSVALKKVFAAFRRDLNAPDVPIVAGEILYCIRKPDVAAFNANLHTVCSEVERCRTVSAEGLKDKGDLLHFDSPSLILLGRRYFEAFETVAK